MSLSTEQIAQTRAEIIYTRELVNLAGSKLQEIEKQFTNGALKPSLQNGSPERGRPRSAQGQGIHRIATRRGRKPAARAAQARQAAGTSASTWVIPTKGPFAGKTYEEAEQIRATMRRSQKARKRPAAPAAQGNFDRMTGQVRRGRPRKQAAA